jgi:MFS family permease
MDRGSNKMSMDAYRRVLALRGVRSLLLVSVLARLALVATGVTLTLHVVLGLDRGYGQGGLVAAAFTLGTAAGAPILGRLIDRHGLRPIVASATALGAAFWCGAPFLPYPALLATALVGGLVEVPAFTVVRQSLAAMVPEAQRRPAYALDSMAVELSFIAGPALAVLVATTVSPTVAVIGVGAAVALGGVGLFLLNPPTREAGPAAAGPAAGPRRREWLRGRMLAMLAVAIATTIVLVGTDISIVAMMRESGQVGWTGAVLALWGCYSLAGGFAYGAAPRALPPFALLGLLALATLPVGLVGGGWWWLALAMVPAGMLCAPTLAAGADAVSRLAPAPVRGEAMGWLGSANTLGLALGAPLTGAVIDASAPAWGFAAVGTIGATVAVVVATTTGRTTADRGVPDCPGVAAPLRVG